MLGTSELTALRGWLVAIALFEVPNIVGLLKGAPLDGFGREGRHRAAQGRRRR